MANQPKKYKKFVATAATATLVAAAIVPAASAAGFKDVPANHEHVEAINALTEEGIINGYTDGTFKPGQAITRGQVVKLLGRWLETQGQEIPADWNSEQRFSDVPVDGKDPELVKYAALTKDAGVFNGSNGKLTASQNISRQQMAVVLVRAIEEIEGVDLVAAYKEDGFETEISDLDKAFSSEQTEAITALEYAEITIVPSGKFRPTESLNRGQFASFLYRTINLELDEVGLDATVKAINNTTVEVTFDEEVEDIKALDFAIEGLEVNNAAVKQQGKGNENVVVLTTSAQTADVVYTVSVNEEEIGSFKGIGSIIPTKISVETTSIQAKVGTQVSIKANIGQEAAGVPVTFNVQATGNSLNSNKVVEVLTDAKGVATYTYTQYGVAGVDNVTAYPTGAPSLLGYAKVYWGKEQILTVDTEEKTVDNGANRTYTVKYLDPTTGLPVQNAKLNVAFNENLNDIDASTTNDTNASIRKDSGAYVTPYQDTVTKAGSNREETFQVTTNSKGEATFVVTGKNTTATPVVYEDKNANNRFENTELQVKAGSVKFQGVQSPYTITFDKKDNTVAALSYEHGQNNPVEYKLKVVTDKKDKDGNALPYVGATIKVAIQQNQDASLSNNTPAQISKSEETGYDTNQVVSVTTDKNGEASVYVRSSVDNSNATPVAWIDLNAAGQPGQVGNGKLEDGEPFGVAGTVTFLKSVVVAPSYTLNAPTKGAFVNNDTMTWKASLQNQSNNVSETAGIKTATYTITNTSNAVQNIKPTLVGYKDLTVTYNGATQTTNFANGGLVTLEPGTTVTIHGVANNYVKTYNNVAEYSTTTEAVLNIVAPKQDGKLSVSGAVTTVRKSPTGDVRNDNNTYYYDAKEAEYLVSTDVTGGAVVTGEVIGFDVNDAKFFGPTGNYGRVVIKERVTGQIKHYYYNSTTAFSSSLDGGSFTGFDNILLTDATSVAATKFENLVSLGDEVQVNNTSNATNPAATNVRLFNKDNSNDTKQAKGNGVDTVKLNITGATTKSATAAGTGVDQIHVTFNKALTQADVDALQTLIANNKLLTGVTLNATANAFQNPRISTTDAKVLVLDLVTSVAGTHALHGSTVTFGPNASINGTFNNLSTVIKDGVSAKIIAAVPTDSDKEGSLDTVEFTFSEPVNLASADATDFRFFTTSAGTYVSGKSVKYATDAKGNVDNKKLVVEFDNRSDFTTTVNYNYAFSNSAAGNTLLLDVNGFAVETQGGTATTGTPPVGGSDVALSTITYNYATNLGSHLVGFEVTALPAKLQANTTFTLTVGTKTYTATKDASGYVMFTIPMAEVTEAQVKAGLLN